MAPMDVFASHPRTRWVVPAVAVAAIAGVTVASTMSADASEPLPPRTAAQLLVDVQQARLTGLSGTVVQTSDLGLPSIPGLGSGSGASSSSDLGSLVAGTHTMRVWYGGAGQQRVALLGSLGESDVIHNGADVWVWSSKDKTATHYTRPVAPRSSARPDRTPPVGPTDLPTTPDQAAALALTAIDPTTAVTTDTTAPVAGRAAYELVLTPRDRASLVRSVRIAVDAEQHIPLRVQVYSTKQVTPAFEVGFTQVDFTRPEARQFAFTPPPGTTVTQGTVGSPSGRAGATPPTGPVTGATGAKEPRVIGTGWTSVLVTNMPTGAENPAPGADRSAAGGTLQQLLEALPAVSGSWGSGHLFAGTLFSAVVTDDGRVAVGAVTPPALYAALAAR